jgi:DHA2 family methylenomycin A resistance protein-like MFS transporter
MFLPLTGLVTAVNLLAGRVTAARGPRLPLIAGQFLFAAGLIAFAALVDADTSALVVELLLVPLGVGAGLVIPPLTTALMESVSAARAGLAAGVLNAARQLGSAVGVAVFGSLLASSFVGGMHRALLIAGGAMLVTAVLTLRYVHAD